MEDDGENDVWKKYLAYLKRTRDLMSWRADYKYPQNLLRNNAKHGCQSNYTMIVDIDMIPVANFDLELEQFLLTKEVKNCQKCVYIVPTFEIEETEEDLPKDKGYLAKLVNEGKSRIYNQKISHCNQYFSDLLRWIQIPKAKSLDVAFRVKEYGFGYEPVYVGRADTPGYNVKFLGYGFTRVTQVIFTYCGLYTIHKKMSDCNILIF